jgi:hypothetical protein
MKTTINIGTNRGNIVGVTMDKPFNKITIDDIYSIASVRYPTGNIRIHGWSDITTKYYTK